MSSTKSWTQSCAGYSDVFNNDVWSEVNCDLGMVGCLRHRSIRLWFLLSSWCPHTWMTDDRSWIRAPRGGALGAQGWPRSAPGAPKGARGARCWGLRLGAGNPGDRKSSSATPQLRAPRANLDEQLFVNGLPSRKRREIREAVGLSTCIQEDDCLYRLYLNKKHKCDSSIPL